jgi:hypothetical protein
MERPRRSRQVNNRLRVPTEARFSLLINRGFTQTLRCSADCRVWRLPLNFSQLLRFYSMCFLRPHLERMVPVVYLTRFVTLLS